MELTFTETGKHKHVWGKTNEVLSFGCIKFELLNKHLSTKILSNQLEM